LFSCAVCADNFAIPGAAIQDFRVNVLAFRLSHDRSRHDPVGLAGRFLRGPSEHAFDGSVAVLDPEEFIQRQNGVVDLMEQDLIEQGGLQFDLPAQFAPDGGGAGGGEAAIRAWTCGDQMIRDLHPDCRMRAKPFQCFPWIGTRSYREQPGNGPRVAFG
jgi:hypothetical protein